MIYIHNRIAKRHPELSESDIVSAWTNAYAATIRMTNDGPRQIAVGYDSNNRAIEMVAIELEVNSWLIYHAMTPPSQKTYEELRLKGYR